MAIGEAPVSPSTPYSEPPIPPERVSLVTYKIRYLIEELIPVEIKVPSSQSPSIHVYDELN